MVVQLYVDLLSQPSRAVALFVKKLGIPHEIKLVSLAKGEQKKPEYLQQVHRFGKVPAINDNGFNLIESIAILRYLARKYKVPDHWYPQDLEKQAKVDEFLEWHHLSERLPIAMYCFSAYFKPFFLKENTDEKEIQMWKTKMEEALDLMENVWLSKTPFLVGNEISIADLIGVCEVEQTRVIEVDVLAGKPKIKAWIKRVQDELQPHYNEVFQTLDQVAAMIKSKKN